jgi:hypothetical protein
MPLKCEVGHKSIDQSLSSLEREQPSIGEYLLNKEKIADAIAS